MKSLKLEKTWHRVVLGAAVERSENAWNPQRPPCSRLRHRCQTPPCHGRKPFMKHREHKMKKRPSNSNNVNQGKKAKRSASKKIIGADQPFDLEEVASITGSEYVQNLRRDGVSILPYEELKKKAPGLNLLENRCIWMRAGVINFRICDGENDCHHCPFDQAMRGAMGEVASPRRK